MPDGALNSFRCSATRQMPRRRAFEGRRMCLRKAPKDHTLIGLCVMYCGTGYRGMQLQTHAPTHHTVEGVLIQALRDVGLVGALERGRIAGDAHHFARSCRTDRGVHATRNMVCLFVPNDKLQAVGCCEHLVKRLNTVLPLTIRVARVTPLMGNFIPRFQCSRRVYRYLIPAYALVAPCDTWKSFYEKFPTMADSFSRHAQVHPFVDLFSTDATEEWHTALAAAVTRGNELLQRVMVGTHRFHNFSVDPVQTGGPAWNRKVIMPSSNEAVRTIRRCEMAPRVFLLPRRSVGPTRMVHEEALAVLGATGFEEAEIAAKRDGDPPDAALLLPFVVFQIEGNSFLFNMIRKMVGVLLAVVRGAREALVTEALSPERRVACPLAPGPYLYLFLSVYRGYDQVVRNSQTVRFRPIEDEWCGHVAAEAAAFAEFSVAADILDVDLNRIPAMGTLLATRDDAQRVMRPCWDEEDRHLSTLKEYRPAAVEPHPKCSEMTMFLRSLRVHNWSVEVLKPPIHGTGDHPADGNNDDGVIVKQGRKNCRDDGMGQKLAGEVDSTAAEAVAQAPKRICVEGSHSKHDNNNNNNNDDDDAATVVPHYKDDNDESVDDGWLYVAPTKEAEQCRRREYHRSMREHSRSFGCNTTLAVGGLTDNWNNDDCGSE